MKRFLQGIITLFSLVGLCCAQETMLKESILSIAAYQTIQEAIDANPGMALHVPNGTFEIHSSLRINHDGTCLTGPGTILQTDISQPILETQNTRDVRIEGITLTRKQGSDDCRKEGILAIHCINLTLDNVRVIGNCSQSGSIVLRECQNSRVSHCLVRNYMTLGVDDRTANPALGYAFKCIDGTGIQVLQSHGVLLSENQIIEETYLPTRDIKDKLELGAMFKQNEQRGAMIDEQYWNAKYFPAWHQGAAIQVGGQSNHTRIIGNHIENAAQGIDNHSDHAIISGNVIANAFLGMKAMHGSRNVIIQGNQFSKNDLWSILLMPGALSRAAGQPDDDPDVEEPNVDGGTVVANNIISDFGYGSAAWNWEYDGPGSHCCPIALLSGQEPSDPPLRDVVLIGNVIYNTALDEQPVDGKVEEVKPRYKYAVYIAKDRWQPQNLVFSSNIFHAGEYGVCNIEIKP